MKLIRPDRAVLGIVSVLSFLSFTLSSHAQIGDPGTESSPSGSRQLLSGSLSGGGAVTPDLFTGAMSTSIPIEVPPGRNGMDPDLALTYNSRGSNGWLGVGWELEVGSIERSTKNGVTYDGGDEFLLRLAGAAVDLVRISGSPGQDGLFRAKIEGGYQRIEKLGTSWKITDKTGMKYFFGQSVASQQYNPDKPNEIFKWFLERAEDTNGNFMSLSYLSMDQGQVYPDKIEYAGHGSIQPPNHVKFHWEGRTDAPEMYTTNFKVVTAKRLKTIEVKANDILQRAYNLSYATSLNTAQSLLTGVQQYGNDAVIDPETGSVTGGTTLPAFSTGYTAGIKSFTALNDPWTTAGASTYANTLGDFNGDGKTDFIQYSDTEGWRVFISTGTTFRPYEIWATGYGHPFVGDFNGDGKSDLMMDFETQGWRVYLSTGSTFCTTPSATGGCDSPYEIWATAGFSTYANIVADFNGDGKSDLMQFAPYQGWRVFLSTGSTFCADLSSCVPGSYKTWTNSGNGELQRLGDFNGDGKTDLMLYATGEGWRVFLSTGSTFCTVPSATGGCDKPYEIWATDGCCAHDTAADFNGDGKTDFMHYDSTRGWRVHLSNGSIFLPYTIWTTSGEGNALLFGDYNGDGKTDLMMYVNWSGWRVFLSTGSDFLPPTIWTTAGAQPGSMIGDFNGDGKSDMIQRPSTGWRVLLSDANTDYVNSISNGLGGTTTIFYRSSTDYNNTQLPISVPNVSTVTTDDGRGTISTTTYDYSGGYYHIGEHDFRGFNYVKVTGPVGSNGEQTISETWFHQGDDTGVDVNNPDCSGSSPCVGFMKGKPYRTKVSDGNGNTYTETTTSYHADLDSGPAYFNPSAKVDTYICDGDAVCRQVQAVYPVTGYDAYGNVTTEIQNGDVADPNDNRTVTRTYSANTTDYIVGLPASETLSYLSGGTAKTLTTEYYYDGSSDCSVASGSAMPTKGKVTRVVKGGMAETRMGYDQYGNLLCTRDANGNISTIGYDPSNTFPTTVTNALGHRTTTIYYGVGGGSTTGGLYGQVQSVTDPNGLVTSTQYDALGRKIRVDNSAGQWTTLSYNSFGTVGSQHIYSTTVAGLSSWSYFDGLGRTYREEKTGPEAKTVRTDTVYDARGQVAGATLPYFGGGAVLYTNYWHDAVGRVVKTQNADGTIALSCYNDGVAAGLDANGRKKRQTTDALGRVVRVDEYNGTFATCDTLPGAPYASTYYQYDGMGSLLQVTDAKGDISRMTYDTLGRKLTMHDPDMGDWSYAYDLNGNLTWQKDAKGQQIFFRFDALNRRVQKDYGTQKALGLGDVVYKYDQATSNGIGRLTYVKDASGETTFYYNLMGQAIRTDRKVGTVTYITQNGYDLAGRVASIVYPNGSTVNYAYLGTTLETVKEGTTTYARYSNHTPLGQPQNVTYANGVVTNYSYNATNFRMNTLKTSAAGGGVYQDLTYGYDSIGNIKTITDPVNVNQSFNYDHLNRLISATGAYGTKTYAYDAIGNMICNQEVGTCTEAAPNYTYPTSGATSVRPHAVSTAGANGYQYDANGNMISGAGRTLAYDYENRLASVVASKKTTTLVYDGDGGRVKKTVGSTVTLYIGKLYECTGTSCIRHIFAGSQRIAQAAPGSKGATVVTYFHGDHLGSTSVATTSTGTLAQKFVYYPYGKLYQSTIYTGTATPYKYTGQMLDDSTGLYFYNARYYDAAIGRFTQADTIVPNPGDPQALNRYSYVRNNPIIFIDPSGHGWLRDARRYVSKHTVQFGLAIQILGGPGGFIAGGHLLSKTESGTHILTREIQVGTVAVDIALTASGNGWAVPIVTAASSGAIVALNGGSTRQVYQAAAISGGVAYATSGIYLDICVGVCIPSDITNAVARGYAGGYATARLHGASGQEALRAGYQGAAIAGGAATSAAAYKAIVGWDIDIRPGGEAVDKGPNGWPVYGANNSGFQGMYGPAVPLCTEGDICSKIINGAPLGAATSTLHDVFQIILGHPGGFLNYSGMLAAFTITATGSIDGPTAIGLVTDYSRP